MDDVTMNAGAESTVEVSDAAATSDAVSQTQAGAGTQTAAQTTAQTQAKPDGVSMLSGNAEMERNSWCDELPDDLKDNQFLRSFKEPEDALKSLINAQKVLGRKGLAAPAQGAPKEEWEAYFAQRRGGLSSVNDYRMKYDEKRMVGMDKGHYDEISQFLFKNGLGDREHSAVMYALGKLREAEAADWDSANAEHCKACKIELMEKLGDRYESEMNLVQNFMNTRFPGVRDSLQRYGLENDTGMMEFLMYAAHAGQEGRAPQGTPMTARSAENLDKRIQKLWDTPALRDRTSPGHAEAQRQFKELMAEKAQMRAM